MVWKGRLLVNEFDKVKAKNFYQDDGDKTLLNWCLYEYANVLYTKIEESPKLASYRKKNCAKEIEEFCVYFSKRLRKSVNDARQVARRVLL